MSRMGFRWSLIAVAVFALLAQGRPALAQLWGDNNDLWDWGGAYDDDNTTSNELLHGAYQIHNVVGSDWARVNTMAEHSYEARVSGQSKNANINGVNGRLDRVTGGGTVLSAATYVGNVASVRWIAALDQTDYVRVIGSNCNPGLENCVGVLEFFDTTYFVPRWNNSASQLTFFIVQNTTRNSVAATGFFHNGTGTLLDAVPVTIPPYGVVVLNTAADVNLQGASGSALIAHDGGYGALQGKAVSLEPSTGFTFDTLIGSMPR